MELRRASVSPSTSYLIIARIDIAIEEKLLKPGTTYTVGRAKAGQSLLNRINLEQKSISHEHVEIIVGHYEIDDVVSQLLTGDLLS
jgi:hypothetical protein